MLLLLLLLLLLAWLEPLLPPLLPPWTRAGSQSDHPGIMATLGVPVAEPVPVPEVLITAVPLPKSFGRDRGHLPEVSKEAAAVQAAFGGPTKAEIRSDITVAELARLLAAMRVEESAKRLVEQLRAGDNAGRARAVVAL